MTSLPYTKLPEDEDDGTEDKYEVPVSTDVVIKSWRILIANIVLFTASVCLLGVSLASTRSRRLHGRDLLRQTTFYSPLIEQVSPKWSAQQSITYPLTQNESILRQDPSPEVDAHWDRIAELGVMTITAAQLKALGKDPSTALKAPESWGRGNDAYPVEIDGIHLLHCLNAMRRSLHYNFPYYYPNGHKAGYHAHLTHCQEALARWIMCQPSMELLTFSWVERHAAPFPDFDITRKCWDYEGLLAWQEEHRVENLSREEWAEMRVPDGVEPLRSPVLNDEALNAHAVTFNESYEGMPNCI